MNNFIQPGDIVTLTAPTGGVISGNGYLIGSLFVVAAETVAQTLPFEGAVVGVFTLPKLSAQAWTEGEKVYWDNGNTRCTSVATDGALIGVAAAVAANPSATGNVRLNGAVPALAEGPQAAIASFTFGTNIAAATANNALTDSSATNPTEGQFNELAKELGVKINDILVALRAAGVIAT